MTETETATEIQSSSTTSMTATDERNWAMLCHLSSLAGFVVPFAGIFGPLVVWLMKRDQSEAIDYHGKESLNFHINTHLFVVVASTLMALLGWIPILGWGLIAVLLPMILVVCVADLVYTIIGALKAKDGEYITIPFIIRFVS